MLQQNSLDRFDQQHTARRSHAIASAAQPHAMDKSDIHPMFGYITRTLKALFLMQGPLFITGFRQKIEQSHPLSLDEKVWLSEQYRNIKTYDEFLEFLCGVNDETGIKKSNFIPYWQTKDANGEDDSIPATNQLRNFLQSVINNHGPLAYIDKISSTLTLLGLEPHFYTEKEVTSWTR